MSTAGEAKSDGSHAWDLTAMLAGDHDELIETMPLEGQWFAGDFAGATYSSRLSDSEDLLGVFQVTDTALLLLGVASPSSGLTQTELTYDPPVTLLAFPVDASATWTTTATVTGQASGVLAAYTEAYASKVDGHGKLSTPFGAFDVLRVRTDLTRTIGVGVTTMHSFLFVTECFGTVATITSQPYEVADEFTTAAEITRLAP